MLHVGRELAVVLVRLVGLGVAVHAHVAHARGGDEVEDAVDHAEAGAQDRDDGDLLAGDALAGGDLERGLHLDGLEGEVARGLVALEQGELAHEVAELLGAGLLVAKDSHLVLDHRVVDERHAGALVGREADGVEGIHGCSHLCHEYGDAGGGCCRARRRPLPRGASDEMPWG